MTNESALRAPLRRLAEEDAVGQLRRRDGRMAALGSEDGALKLDWVEAVPRLLADPALLESVEGEARAIRERGIRHILWAGMGGSVLTVRVLRDLGFCGGRRDTPPADPADAPIAIHPLDSTDPTALNVIVREIAAAKGLALPDDLATRNGPAFLRALLGDVLMIGVAMGMTSEEPITHLAWFTELLERAGLPPVEHLLVMALPGSHLDAFARERRAPSVPLQPDGGTGTGGRMSAPGTRVFLLPAALYLSRRQPGSPVSAGLRAVLQRAWDAYDLALAAAHPAQHPFARLAAALSAASRDGACRMLVRMPAGWGVFVPWLEQLMEESLGKRGKGVVVFDDQPLDAAAPAYDAEALLRVRVVADSGATTGSDTDGAFTLAQPALASAEPHDRLTALAASFLGWQLTMALYGYLHGIQFAGQPAVENYKARARALRTQPDPLHAASQWQPAVREGALALLAPAGALPTAHAPAASDLAQALWRLPRAAAPLRYLDVTVNGEAPERVWALLDERVRRTIGNALLGVPVKLRRAPADYHSTEQGEMDGPPHLVSLRLVARTTEPPLVGSYAGTFLHAQAVSTWQAMLEAGRACCLLVIDGTLDGAFAPLADVLSAVERYARTA